MSKPFELEPMFTALDGGDLEAARTRARSIRQSATRTPKAPAVAHQRHETVESPLSVASQILTPLPPGPSLAEVTLPGGVRAVLQLLVREQGREALLAKHGLSPRRRVLFVGPPGLGKSMTAHALATELGWPAYVTRMDSLVRSFLGQTASRVRDLFGFAASTQAVILLDEIDAIARRRGATSDVGEIDRVVVTLLQEMEHSHPAGLLIATSNLPDHLDEALWRRFDMVVRFAAPTRKQLNAFARSEAKRRGLPVRALSGHEDARSFADVSRVVADLLRERLLRE